MNENDLGDKWWLYDARGRMWLKFHDICLTAEERLRKNLNQEIGPIVARTLARWVICDDVILDYNGGFMLELI